MDLFKTYYSKLVAVLPMDNLSEFCSRELMPGDNKDKIKSLATRNEKAEYFLDKVIRPGLVIGYDKQFKDMLELMENSDDGKVKYLAETIKAESSASRDNPTTTKENTNYPSALMKYSTSDINSAYHNLVSEITDIIETKNFKKMRRACYAEIRAVGGTLPESLIQELQCTKSVDDMLDTLAMSPYWNWFDTRLLQAVVSSSRSSEAQTLLEQFRQLHYARRVNEILPYVSIVPLENSVIFTEKFGKEPHEITLLDIIRHKHILEYEVLDIGDRKLILSCIKAGCVELTWHVPRELVYQAYTSMQTKHDKLSSLAVKSLVCVEADELAGLPIMWCGQEVNGTGPIEPLPDHVRQEPYSLPQGFHWIIFSNSDAEMVKSFCMEHTTYNVIPGKINITFSHPTAKSDWRFGISTTNGKLVAVVLAYSLCFRIQGTSVRFGHPSIYLHKKYNKKRLTYILLKEFARRINHCNINQMIQPVSSSIAKPVVTTTVWEYDFSHHTSHQLPNSPRTPGWRNMTSADVPSALRLVNKYLSQFEIGRVFTAEDFSHCFFLPAASHGFVHTYVVENMSKDITDLVSAVFLHTKGFLGAHITLVASMQSPLKQLIMDMMVCVRDNAANAVFIDQCNIRSDILSSLLFKQIDNVVYNFYNYKYPEITEDKFCFARI